MMLAVCLTSLSRLAASDTRVDTVLSSDHAKRKHAASCAPGDAGQGAGGEPTDYRFPRLARRARQGVAAPGQPEPRARRARRATVAPPAPACSERRCSSRPRRSGPSGSPTAARPAAPPIEPPRSRPGRSLGCGTDTAAAAAPPPFPWRRASSSASSALLGSQESRRQARRPSWRRSATPAGREESDTSDRGSGHVGDPSTSFYGWGSSPCRRRRPQIC